MKSISKCMAIGMTILAASCSDGSNKERNDVSTADQTTSSTEQTSGVTNELLADSTAPLNLRAGQPAAPIDWDRKIIKTATVTLEVPAFKKFSDELRNKVKHYGGYVAAEEQSETAGRITNNTSIKVPVAQFDDLMAALTSGDARLIEKTVSTNDVTGEVVDTRSRIEAKKLVRLRYLQLLNKAKNMNEILQVQNEINSIQEHLETASGRVNYLGHQSAFSTINLSYFQYLVPQTAPLSTSVFTEIIDAFRDGGNIIYSVVLGLISIWPLIVAALAGWHMVKRFRSGTIKQVKQAGS